MKNFLTENYLYVILILSLIFNIFLIIKRPNIRKISLEGFLFMFSLSLTFALLVCYFLWRLFDFKILSNLYDFSYNSGFLWIFFTFILLCNLSYLRGAIKDIVEEKLGPEIKRLVRKEVKERIFIEFQKISKEVFESGKKSDYFDRRDKFTKYDKNNIKT